MVTYVIHFRVRDVSWLGYAMLWSVVLKLRLIRVGAVLECGVDESELNMARTGDGTQKM